MHVFFQYARQKIRVIENSEIPHSSDGKVAYNIQCISQFIHTSKLAYFFRLPRKKNKQWFPTKTVV